VRRAIVDRVVGSQITSTLLTLLVLPVLYGLIGTRKKEGAPGPRAQALD
jgi:Cu/Ag efflux pump CusA